MKLVSTTDEIYKGYISDECSFSYCGDKAWLYLEHCPVSLKVKQITREGNRVVITTENNTYILED